MHKLRFKLVESVVETYYSDPVSVDISKVNDEKYEVIVYVKGSDKSYFIGSYEDEEIARNHAEDVIDKLAGKDYETYDDVVKILKETEDVGLEEVPEQSNFIESAELNELREVFLNIPDNVELLLLNDEVIVIGLIEDQVTYLYTLPEESEDFVLLEMPLELSRILNDPDIIKYTPDKVDERHSKVHNIFKNKLGDGGGRI